MADTKISGLSAVTDVLGTDEFVLARSSTTKKIAASDLAAFFGADAGDGWYASADSWTYASASTFTVSGDVTAIYTRGTRLKFTQTTVKYAVVVASSHAAGTTTVTIAVNSNYTIANAAISDNYYSYAQNPRGYPTWFTFDPAATGFTGSVTYTIARYKIDGAAVTVIVLLSGTSNATTLTFTLPVATSANSTNETAVVAVTDNGSSQTSPGRILLGTSSSTATVGKAMNASGGFTGSGTKGVNAQFVYEF